MKTTIAALVAAAFASCAFADETLTADVVVIGGGAAGMPAGRAGR